MNRSFELQHTDPAADMYGGAALPDLIPPACAMRPSAVIPYGTDQAGAERGAAVPPRRMNRAPKLAQIGRSKRVDLNDEDLDDIMNNNRNFPMPIGVSPVA
ncbi:uncharacterized protein si:dkey-112a7.4 [Trichomycterus rosablanca]|uniref:uncharacterized protein si:dkey-112a7.4 n=1 Tax=Trichomycterus rosablanca TaxID=2290929 RepID=UPI002F34F4FA